MSVPTTIRPGVLSVGGNVPHPILMFERDGEITGLEWDLVSAVAAGLGLEPRLVRTPWIGALDELLRSRFDVLAFGVSMTPERERRVLFAGPYLETRQAVAVRADGPIERLADLRGRRVGVVRETTSVAAGRTIEGAEVVAYDPMVPSFRVLGQTLPDLEAGRLDAVVHDEPVLGGFVRYLHPGLRIVATIGQVERYGLAFAPERRDLRDAVQEVLDGMASSGELDRIRDGWLAQLRPG